jgi:hypothetical protein
LIRLLEHLGYQDTDNGFRHTSRKVIFLGDFIDRGEALAEHKQLLSMVMKMVRSGNAMAVMGNHEFNALAYHTYVDGRPLRAHSPKNTKQHQAFLNEFDDDPQAKNEVLQFFFELPLWLELENLRVVHACWDDWSIESLIEKNDGPRMSHDLLMKASNPDLPEYKAVETLLKGCEVRLPNGVGFLDKDGNRRDAVRVQWWKQKPINLGDIALPLGVDIGKASSLKPPDDIPRYDPAAKPCFIGHYWLSGKPCPLSDNVACLDYSVAKQGKLVAYRWSGEASLTSDNFTFNREM